jgi:hypothetical protein
LFGLYCFFVIAIAFSSLQAIEIGTSQFTTFVRHCETQSVVAIQQHEVSFLKLRTLSYELFHSHKLKQRISHLFYQFLYFAKSKAFATIFLVQTRKNSSSKLLSFSETIKKKIKHKSMVLFTIITLSVITSK